MLGLGKKVTAMWLAQICIAAFWWTIGIMLLFHEARFWRAVEHIAWFRSRFGSSATRGWERFGREAGSVCLLAGCLLFIKLPYGMGVLGLLLALPPLIVMLCASRLARR